MSAKWMTAVAVACALATTAQAKPPPKSADELLAAKMVGTWINPPDSADYEGVPSREVYNADGTYLYYEYEDKACQKLASSTMSKWYVWEGALFTEFAEGNRLKDAIVSMQGKKVVLRSPKRSAGILRLSTKCLSAWSPPEKPRVRLIPPCSAWQISKKKTLKFLPKSAVLSFTQQLFSSLCLELSVS